MKKKIGNCFYCGEPATTEDHIIPVVLGGKRLNNTVLACLLCNTTRGCVPQQDFIKFIQWLNIKDISFKGMTRKNRRAMKLMFYRETGIKIGLSKVVSDTSKEE